MYFKHTVHIQIHGMLQHACSLRTHVYMEQCSCYTVTTQRVKVLCRRPESISHSLVRMFMFRTISQCFDNHEHCRRRNYVNFFNCEINTINVYDNSFLSLFVSSCFCCLTGAYKLPARSFPTRTLHMNIIVESNTKW